MNTVAKLSGIVKNYPNKQVLRGIDLEIKSQTVHGLLGPNGAGKSTLMNIILGLSEQDSGEIIRPENLKIGYMSEHLPLYMEMDVWSYLEFIQNIYDYPNKEYLEKIIKELSLGEYKHTAIGKLSKGYKQRVALAGAICHNPDLLVLDEPMVGMDPNALMQMKDLIISLAKEHTIFISSHQLHDLSQVCSVISIINNGVVAQHGSIEEIEKKLNANIAIEIEIENDESDKINAFCKEQAFDFQKITDLKYQISSEKDIDTRAKVSHFLMEAKIPLVSMKKITLNLEEIFKKVTEAKND